jgi:hypothetical protein
MKDGWRKDKRGTMNNECETMMQKKMRQIAATDKQIELLACEL